MVEDSSSWAGIGSGRRRMRSRRLVVLAVSALVGVCVASACALAADGSARLTAVQIRVGDHPAFVRAVIDFAHGTLSDNQVEAIDPQPFDGSARLRISHPMVRTRAPARTADGITVRVAPGSGQLRIDIRAPVGLFKYLAYAVVTSDRLAIDLWKTAPPSIAAEHRDGRGGCLTLDRVRARAGLVSAAGTEHNLFEHQFRVLLRAASGLPLVQRLVHAAGRWSAQLGYHATRGQAATLEAVALSAKDGALACLVQVRVDLPPSSANDALAGTDAVATVGGPVPRGTSATSVTFVSPRTAFVLGTAPCARRPCTAIVHTRDRGRSWRGLPAPLEPVSAPYGTGLWGLRFADAQRGYAFGDGLWVTTNGSASWRRAPMPEPIVVAFAAVADRELIAVTASCRPGSSGCAHRLTLYRRSIAAATWQKVVTVGPNAFDATIAVHGNVVWVLIAQRLFVSTDRGRMFSSYAQPCRGASAAFEPVSIGDDGPHTYLLCTGQGFTGHTLKYLYVTSGNGSGWTLIGRPPAAGDGGELAVGSDAALVIATSSAASWLDRSNDQARHWRTALTYADGGEGWGDLGFTTPVDGAVIHGPADVDGGSANHPGQLLLSNNGGRSWQVARF